VIDQQKLIQETADAINGLRESFDKFDAIALQVKRERDVFLDALYEVRELIEGYQDTADGDYGVPVANKAMKAVMLIDDAIALAGRK